MCYRKIRGFIDDQYQLFLEWVYLAGRDFITVEYKIPVNRQYRCDSE